MRGCLKSHPPTPTGSCTPLPQSPRKSVAFELEEALETVFIADEWDRTPMEPSRKLSYQDLLELKEIQRSLPRANQPPDHLSGRAGKHYLKGVPIGLLPLLPESDSSSSSTPTSPTTSPTPGANWTPFSPSRSQPMASPPQRGYSPVFQPPPSSNLHPSNLAQPRQKPRFAFLPLLDSAAPGQTPPRSRSRTPSPARSDPPTPSLTYASLESSPMSQASSCSTEPPSMHLPPRWPASYHHAHAADDSESFPRSLSSAMNSMNMPPKETPTSFGRSNPAFKPVYAIPPPPPASVKPKRQRNVIVVNGVEIDLDGSDDEDDEPPAKPVQSVAAIFQPQPMSPLSSPSRSSGSGSPSSITSNGLPTPPPSTSPSPTITQRPLLPAAEPESPFAGLHAPVVFKRRVPSNPPEPTPAGLSTSRQRRGSLCAQERKNGGQQSSPILVSRT